MSDITPVLARSERWAPIAKLSDRFFDLPTWRATAWHLESVDESFLPWFAQLFGVAETEAWQRAQSVTERRAIVKAGYSRQRRVGTPAGLRQASIDAGGRLVRIVAPPNKTFLSSAPSVAERNAWLALHPELRLYPRRVRGTREVAMLGAEFLGSTCFAARSSALVRSRLRATLVKDGVETELETLDWQIASAERQAVNEIVIPGQRGHASFLGRPLAFVAATDASNRRIVLRDVALYNEPTATLGLRTVQVSGLQPLDADGEMVSEVRPATPGATYLGRFPRHSVALDAELRQYRRIRLFDPEAKATRARAASHLGFSRLTMPPHCAQIDVELFGRVLPTVGRFCGRPVAASDHAPLQRLVAAIRLASRESDELTLSTRTFRPVKAGYVKAGSVMAGDLTNQ